MAVYGLGIGVTAAATLSLMAPFSRGDERPLEAGALLVALCGLCVAGGILVLDSWSVAAAAGLTAATGGGAFWLWARREPGGQPGSEDYRVTPRPKQAGDCWALVTGAKGSGKTALVEGLAEAAAHSISGKMRLVGPQRWSDSRDVVELPLALPPDDEVLLRIHERPLDAGAPAYPAWGDLDAIIFTIDPACVEETANSFLERFRTGEVVDADAAVLALEAALAKAGNAPALWLAITKADLIRFSIKESLVDWVETGGGWYAQLSGFDVLDRERLAGELGIRTAVHHQTGSPWLTYVAPIGDARPSFGTQTIFDQLIDTLRPKLGLPLGEGVGSTAG